MRSGYAYTVVVSGALAACGSSATTSSDAAGFPAPDAAALPVDAAVVPTPDASTVIDPSDAVFDPTFVHRLDITIAPEGWDDIQYNYGAENWWTADLEFDSEPIPNVGIRAFGAYSARPEKTPIKLSFDRNVDGQEFHGLEQLKLDGSAQDAGFLNDPLAAWVLRSLDLPAARQSWVVVYANGERWGFYTAMEPIDDVFVKRWFDGPEGHLYGTTDQRYGQALNPMTPGGPSDWYKPETALGGDGSDIVAASEAIAIGTDEQVAAVVDTEGIMRVSATRVFMGATDSFPADGNNFYLYNHAGRITMIPWDMDVELGGLASHFTNAVEMGLDQPWLWSHYRINTLTGLPYSDTLYARTLAGGWDMAGWLATVMAGPLDWATIDAKVVEFENVIGADACLDRYHSCVAHQRRIADLRMYLHTRLSRLAGAEVATCPPSDGRTYADGGGAVVGDSTSWGPGFVINGQHHCAGVFAGAPRTITTTVVAGNLAGAVGMADWNQQCNGTSVFKVVQGGVTLWQSPAIGAYQDAVPFDVAVAAGTVTLSTTLTGGCAQAAWVDLAQ